jgi:hypothetical protein
LRKIFLSAAFLAFAGLTTVKANEVKSIGISIQQDSTTKTQVKIDALPEAVKAALKSDKYKTYTPSSAYLITAANKNEWYEVEISNKEGQTASLKIAKDGVVVE